MSDADRVREYWERNVDNWKIAAHLAPASREFFAETEAYRFEKLNYLESRIPFAATIDLDVLEVGCGLGNDLSRFAAAGARVTGIDIAERAVDLSSRNFEQRGLDGTFLQMDGESMTFDDESFDFCYCHTVLQFTAEPARMIAEIHRVLRPGGKALIMALNSRSWLMLLQKLLRTEIDYMDAPVYRMYDVKEFRRLLRAFASIEIIPERFPVPTKVHKGLKARVYNLLFVDLFNMLPKGMTANTGHHLLAYVQKAGGAIR